MDYEQLKDGLAQILDKSEIERDYNYTKKQWQDRLIEQIINHFSERGLGVQEEIMIDDFPNGKMQLSYKFIPLQEVK